MPDYIPGPSQGFIDPEVSRYLSDELSRISDALLGSQIPEIFDDYTELRKQPPNVFKSVYVLGRTSAGDGGEGHFRWDSSDLSTEVGNDEVTSSQGNGGVYIAPTSDKTGASVAWVRMFDDSVFPEWYGSTGTSDDTAVIQAAIDANTGKQIRFRSKTYAITSTGLTMTGSGGTSLIGSGRQSTKFSVTDGSYTALTISEDPDGKTIIEGIWFEGSDSSTPSLTFIDSDNGSYVEIQHCRFRNASVAIKHTNSFVLKHFNNIYAACDQYIKTDTSSGAGDDLSIVCETFGTTAIGTAASVEIATNGIRFIGCYWETQTQSKLSLEVKTGAQRTPVTGCQFNNSGGIKCETSTNPVLSGNTIFDAFDSSNSRAIRIDGGCEATITGNYIDFTTAGSNDAINSSGNVTATGNTIKDADKGYSSSAGVVSGNRISNCTTGVNAPNSDVIVGPNEYASNTTDVARTVSEKTIATGAITIGGGIHYTVDTESDSASDDLDTINGGYEGQIVVLTAADSGRTVVVKDGTGNIFLSADFSMDHVQDTITLFNIDGSNWRELSTASNA